MLTVKLVSEYKTVWMNAVSVVLPDIRVTTATVQIQGDNENDLVSFDMVKMKLREISVYLSGQMVDFIKAEEDDCEQFFSLEMDIDRAHYANKIRTGRNREGWND